MAFFLASQSPRRRDILQQIGVPFIAHPVTVDETPQRHEDPGSYVSRLALAKARAGLTALTADQQNAAVVLGADTSVVLDGDILGKPADAEAARTMLARLSGRSHQVLSAVALVAPGREATAMSVTEVSFRPLTTLLIERYWQTGEPADKAGSYGIQGLGAALVESIRGSYTGVVGLPVEALLPLLEQFAIPYWQLPGELRP